MDDAPQGHVVDASLALLRKLEDEMRVLNGSQPRSSDSSNSSATLDSLNVARKRKRLDSSREDQGSKKIRIPPAGQNTVVFGPAELPRHDRSLQLPAELWHHIFSFLSPDTLGRLLRVNWLFHRYLDPVSLFITSAVIHVPTTRVLPTLSPDAIWRASRRLHWPTMPAPLKGRFELDMWRFACTRSCQLCGQLDKTYTTEDPPPRGQGNTTVSPIFPFFINSCGDCLAEKSLKEVDLLLSTSSPSFISPGLPMVFLTPDMNVISPQAMRSTPSVPVQLTKVYWPAQVEKLQQELEDVKRFGAAAAEEWIKGLDSRGTEAVHDASRWDKWFLSGGVRQMRIHSTQPTPTAANNKVERIRIKGSEIAKVLRKHRQDGETVVRTHISNLADEVIRDCWFKGRSVKKENCTDFVTDVLAYVRKQFYKDGVKSLASLTGRLTLDDMRWIFNNKIAPHTDHHHKEFLICRECPKRKQYGFQAIIQHYSMKHCSKKMKSMAMQWRAEWPEVPPFRSPLAEQKITGTTPAPEMHRHSDEQPRNRADNFRTQIIDERFETHEGPDRMRAQYIAREPVEWSGSAWGSAHLSSSVPEPRRHLETYYLRPEHAPHMTQAYVSGYRQPMSSTTLYWTYDIVDVRSLHDHRIPSNMSYSNYTNRESHNTASASRVYSIYDSRDSLASGRSGELE